MRNALRTWAAVGCLITPLFGAERFNGDYLNKLTADHITPHLDWGKPLAAGKIRALFIAPRQGAREIVELI
jgi:hypothetical protein